MASPEDPEDPQAAPQKRQRLLASVLQGRAPPRSAAPPQTAEAGRRAAATQHSGGAQASSVAAATRHGPVAATGAAAAAAGAGPTAAAATAAATGAAAAQAAAATAAGSVDDESLEAPSDVEAAILLLKSEVYGGGAVADAAARRRGKKQQQQQLQQQQQQQAAFDPAADPEPPLPPVILKSQIYTVLSDRTAVDRDLDDLMRRGRARTFKLATAADEHVVLLAADYLGAIDAMAAAQRWRAECLRYQAGQQQQQQQQAGGAQGEDERRRHEAAAVRAEAVAAALERFRDRVVPRCWDAFLATDRLLLLLSEGPAVPAAGGSSSNGGSNGSRAAAGGGAVRSRAAADADVSHLLASELLSRDPALPGRLTLTVPGAGRLVRSIVGGRQDLLGVLGKKRFGEALEKELLKVKLRRSVLGVKFHLRDLLGRGAASRADTPAGPSIRLTRH